MKDYDLSLKRSLIVDPVLGFFNLKLTDQWK